MASIEEYAVGSGNNATKRIRVRWRGFDGDQCSKSFLQKAEAKRFKSEVERAILIGEDELNAVLRFYNIGAEHDPIYLCDLVDIWLREYAEIELTKTTLSTYRAIYNKWISGILDREKLEDLEKPALVIRWRQQIMKEGASPAVVQKAQCVLSSILSYGVEAHPEMIANNGAMAASQRRRRTKKARAATQQSTNTVALSPVAAELMRNRILAMDSDSEGHPHRDPLTAIRGATVISIMSMTGCRRQDVWALRWEGIENGMLHYETAISDGIETFGKTVTHSVPIEPVLMEDLMFWRNQSLNARSPYIFSKSPTSSAHRTEGQMRAWVKNYWNVARTSLSADLLKLARKHDSVEVQHELHHLADTIARCTPYSCRRGYITSAIRCGVDVNEISRRCATSPQSIFRHYNRVITEIQGTRPEETLAETFALARIQAEQLDIEYRPTIKTTSRGKKKLIAV